MVMTETVSAEMWQRHRTTEKMGLCNEDFSGYAGELQWWRHMIITVADKESNIYLRQQGYQQHINGKMDT